MTVSILPRCIPVLAWCEMDRRCEGVEWECSHLLDLLRMYQRQNDCHVPTVATKTTKTSHPDEGRYYGKRNCWQLRRPVYDV